MSYSDLLRDPRWQKLRLEVLNAANWACVCCGAKDIPFNVHHKRYKSGAKPWEYDMSELEAICENCHKTHHLSKKYLSWLANNGTAAEIICLMEHGSNGGFVNPEIVANWLEKLEWWFTEVEK